MCVAITGECSNLITFERMDGSEITSINLVIDKNFTGWVFKKRRMRLGKSINRASSAGARCLSFSRTPTRFDACTHMRGAAGEISCMMTKFVSSMKRKYALVNNAISNCLMERRVSIQSARSPNNSNCSTDYNKIL